MMNSLNQWLDAKRRSCDMHVEQIPWSHSKQWVFNGHHLRHVDGAFFGVVGATLYVDGKRQAQLDQPLIDQPEIGILGFVIRRDHAGQADILVQAKPEPGNIRLVQAAPSVQATESNYQRRHHGKPTPLLEYFLCPEKVAVLSDSLQSEQGTRFLAKYNRNVVVSVPYDASRFEGSALKWFPIHELLKLLLQDFEINTDARSVLASTSWRFLASEQAPFRHWANCGGLGQTFLESFVACEDHCAMSTPEVIERLHRLRREVDFSLGILKLTDLVAWEITDVAISSTQHDTFSVRQYSVATTEREVARWDQPLVASAVEGDVVLLCQERAGVLHFLFNARPEIGFRERFQYGPSIQELGDEPMILLDLQNQAAALRDALTRSDTLISTLHSDEGGRFFRCVSRYRVCLLPEQEQIDLGDNLSWMTLGQIESLIRNPGFFSNEARTLISLMLGYV